MSNKIKGVFAIVFTEDKKEMVMVKRRDFPLWVFPGGGIDDGETPEEACVRELKEETGLDCVIERKVCEYDHKKFIPVRAILYECRAISGTPKITNETKDISYFPISNPPKPFLPLFKEFLEHAFMPSPEVAIDLKSVRLSKGLKFLFENPIITIRFLLTKIGLHLNSN